jgi:hypothetical protein
MEYAHVRRLFQINVGTLLMQNKSAALILVALVLFLPSALLPQQTDHTVKTIFVLFDLTASTKSQRPGFLRDFNKILAVIQPGDTLIADKISENPLAQNEFPINTEFAVFKASTSNPLYAGGEKKNYRKAFQEKKEQIYIQAKEFLNSASADWTDILGALEIADRVFKSNKTGKPILVIMSDMIQDSTNYKFDHETFSPDRITAILRNEKANNGFPNLTGVTVYVTGATGGNTRQFNAIKQFWMSYFKETGAILKDENYGNTLLKFID